MSQHLKQYYGQDQLDSGSNILRTVIGHNVDEA